MDAGCIALRTRADARRLALARRLGGTALVALLAVVASAEMRPDAANRSTPASVKRPRSASELLYDRTPVPLRISRAWQPAISTVVAAWRIESDRALWRTMRFDDWERVPASLRQRALRLMFARYAPTLSGPDAWRGMTTADWDLVPSPVRTIAYLRMIDSWVAHYARHLAGNRQREIADTVAAIVMAESWFDASAENLGRSGNRDLGLAQASDSCRRILARLHQRGVADFRADDDDYFDPLVGTRVATFWFTRLLDRTNGDVNMAIRAYHRGLDRARAGAGGAYLDTVLAKRRRFTATAQSASAWQMMLAYRRASSTPSDQPPARLNP